MTLPFRRAILGILVLALTGAGVLFLAHDPIREALHGTAVETQLRRAKYRFRNFQRTPVTCAQPGPQSPTTGIVLIAIDTLRADHLSVYGYARPVSPHLDALARHSVVFSNAIAPAPWTLPSLGAVFTGFHPGALGIEEVPTPLPPEAITIAEVLCRAGYQTAGVVSHSFVGLTYGFDRGFERWDQSSIGGHPFVSSASVTDRAMAFVDDFDDGRPFFLFAHYFDPHYDYVEHAQFPFSQGYSGPLRSLGDNIKELRRLAASDEFDEEFRNYLIDSYDSEVAFTDHHIGRLMDKLRSEGLYDDALIVVVGDHGEMFAERQSRWIGHIKYLFNSLVRVPLMVKLPSGQSRENVTQPVSTADIRDTIFGAIGHGEADPNRSLLRTRGRNPEPVFSQTRSRDKQSDAVLSENWKLIRHYKSGELELYDLQRDPDEINNVAALNEDVATRLEREILGWLDGVEVQRGKFSRTERPQLSEDEIERLRSLGYVE